MNKPTLEFYGFFQSAYDHFNQALFGSQLPDCMITAQRHKPVMGYFIKDRWVKQDGRKTNEISLNPTYFASFPVLEIFQTLVHEMCHLWQYESGTPSRSGYHNKEWAEKMLAIGLEPISMDKPGTMTGQKVGDKSIAGGLFEAAAKQFIAGHIDRLWFDRYPAISGRSVPLDFPSIAGDGEGEDAVSAILATVVASVLQNEVVSPAEVSEAAEKKRKAKYCCPVCGLNVWGKPGLKLGCMGCDVALEEI